MLPDELILEIYKYCNYSTRININKVCNWGFRDVNPYFDYTFKPIFIEPLLDPSFGVTRNGDIFWGILQVEVPESDIGIVWVKF